MSGYLLKTFLLLLKSLGLVLGLFLFIFILKYLSCPVYTFHQGQPFSGEKFYNPYQGMKPEHWRRANFQIQSYAWAGITSGRGNTNTAIRSLYKQLGYDIIGTSDYQKINRFGKDLPGYVPVYEHGYGIRKTHQVLVGAKRVLWKDYPFFQTIHNKQHIINSLRKDNALIYLAHPLLRNGYSVDDMKLLTGYDGIEVLNNHVYSINHWDTALSQGNYVMLLGNDDVHDISDPDEIGNHSTYVNTASLEEEDILSAIKSGNTYGARLWPPGGESMEEKIRKTKVLPRLMRHEIINDTLYVACDSVVKFIRFIGQHGRVLKTRVHSDTAYYAIQPNDTYVRAEILFRQESVLFMNPVCRYDGKAPGKIPPAEINLLKTWILRIVGFSSLLFVALNVFWLQKRFRRRQIR